MPDQVFLIRHGQSTFNELFDETGIDPFHFDARLSPKGHKQVAATKQAAQRLAVELVVVSPLTRAIETGIGLFGVAHSKIVVSSLHRERLGNSCDVGRNPGELAREFPMLEFSHLGNCWWHEGPKDSRGISVEPDEAVALRIDAFSSWLATQPGKRIAVVGHGTFFHRLTGRHFQNCEIAEWQP